MLVRTIFLWRELSVQRRGIRRSFTARAGLMIFHIGLRWSWRGKMKLRALEMARKSSQSCEIRSGHRKGNYGKSLLANGTNSGVSFPAVA